MNIKPRPLLLLASVVIGCLLVLAEATAGQTGREGSTAGSTQTAAAEQSVIHGRIVRADNGKPVRRARVSVSTVVSGIQRGLATVTNVRGEFTFRNLKAGKYMFLVQAGGLTNSHFDRQEPVEVDGKNEAEALVTVTRGSVINGRVRYADREPVVRQQLVLYREQGENAVSEVPFDPWFTNDRGEYRIAGLPAGTYLVGLYELPSAMSRAGRDENETRTGMAAIFYPSAGNIKEARRITVAEGEEVQNIDIDLLTDDLFSIAGRVRWKGIQQPVAEIEVFLTRKSDPPSAFSRGDMLGLLMTTDSGVDPQTQSQMDFYFANANSTRVVTDADGRWSITDLPPGTYLVQASAEVKPIEVSSDPPAPFQGDFDPVDVKRQIEVTVTDRDLSGLVIELSSGASISGTIADEGTGTLEPLTVRAEAPGRQGVAVSSTDSKPDGTFTLAGLPAGPLLLEALIPISSGRYVRSMTLAGADLLRESYSVTAGAQIDGAQIQLGADLADLTGTVTGADGQPARGALVLLAPVDRTRWARSNAFRAVRCDSEGKFALRLPPGQYLPITWSAVALQVGRIADFVGRYANQASLVGLQPNEQKVIELPLSIADP